MAFGARDTSPTGSVAWHLDFLEAPVIHPSWCMRPPDEGQHQTHVSALVDCNPTADELVGVGARLHRFWPPADGAIVGLQLTENGRSRWYPLTPDQTQALIDALGTLLDLR
ncbi:MAG TPA: hypothetical protein VFW21_01415 [Mycobacterium sp.]|nr:hypothetical protein [Mycobacterium sp.]